MERILYCATTNLEKLKEFRLALAGHCDVEQVPGFSNVVPPEETGATFEENAALKAVYYSRSCEQPVFADDSGLEVDALGGAPGVYSARYAGEHATDEENNRLVLERMRGVQNRTARFVCVIGLASKGDLVQIFRGTVEGRLLDGPQGSLGFGYDPLFFFPLFECSFGEADRERKTEVSHRGKALQRMLAYLRSPEA